VVLSELSLKNLENIGKPDAPLESINNAAEILDKLDSIKKELRLKFKRLTNQEMLVFSTIYQLNEENREVTYNSLAERLGLSQSSIRDYVQRIIIKGIPIEKEKELNKKIILKVSNNITKIASLSTIMGLREL
jgi:DNA-binding MarR family transcriptional regulator